jgi:hypothetical protein
MKTPMLTLSRLGRYWLAALLAGLLVAGGGWGVYAVFFAQPPTPWVVKNRIQRYLKNQSRQGNFAIPFEFPPPQEMSRADAAGGMKGPAKGTLTQKDFSSLREEYLDRMTELLVLQRSVADQEKDLEQRQARLARQESRLAALVQKSGTNNSSALASNVTVLRTSVTNLLKAIPARKEMLVTKEKALEPIESDLWEFQAFWADEVQSGNRVDTNKLAQAQAALNKTLRAQFAEASTYDRMYELIGQELWVASRLFASANLRHRRVALDIARQARSDALDFAQDAWLAARICEAYLWPNLSAADAPDRRSRMNPERLLDECADVFWQADETNNALLNYQFYIAAAGSPREADWARAQLSRTYTQIGDFKAAVGQLKAIKLTNDFDWAVRRLPWLEQRAKNQ